MSWNYRVIRKKFEDEYFLHMHEVYYNKEGQPDSWSANDVSAAGENLKELKEDLKHMLEACNKPILEIQTINNELKLIEIKEKNNE